MEHNTNGTSALGFYSTDGFFQQVHSLTTQNLEFVSKSLYELELILDENVYLERYEKCAQIRDEIIKRALAKRKAV
jgi:protein-arginine kinase activator protein McsA